MRIHQIDALRGFALLGILIVNIFVFHAPYPYYGEFYFQFEGANLVALEYMIFLCAGKFMFIYAFLFGYSFWIQYQKFEEEKLFRSYWNRRMVLLIGFGVLHVLLLSFGDILLPYALLGLTLPFFARLRNSTIIICFLLIYLIPVYEFVLRGFWEASSIFMQPSAPLETYIETNRNGNFLEIFALRMKDYFSFGNEKLIMYIPKEISLFLVGMMAARADLANKLNAVKGSVFCVFALGVIGLMYFFQGNIIEFFDIEHSIVQRSFIGLLIHFSEFAHGCLYIIGFLLLWKVQPLQKLLYPLTYTGKLSLTNYLMQSLICVVIFSGLDYYGTLTPIELIVTALLIYVGQLVFSYLWLQKNRYGPLEYIWRKYSKAGHTIT